MTLDGALAIALLRAESENEQLRKMVQELTVAKNELAAEIEKMRGSPDVETG